MITQWEAMQLISLKKYKIDNTHYYFPVQGEILSIDLDSENKIEKFQMDINRRSIQINKIAYQNRVRTNIPLIRLDFGVGHRNPDHIEIGDPHIHIFREGFGMKWATDPPAEHFTDLNNRMKVLEDFMKYCNIVESPLIGGSLI